MSSGVTTGTRSPEHKASHPSGDGITNASSAVDRALMVLCAFSRETPVLGVTEISERLDLTKSTVHRLLQALLARGLVSHHPDKRHYTLGYRILALAQAVPGEATLRQICYPHMQRLHAATEETIGLYVVAGDVRLCLDEIESPQMLRMSAGVGRIFPLDRGAAGKALLVDGPSDSSLWRRVTASLSAAHIAQLEAELREVRAHGYSQTAGETVSGSASIAAAIRGPDDALLASLSVAGPASRFQRETVIRHATALLEAVSHIERDLAVAYAPEAPQVASRRDQ
ncbi:MAG TPA: IclR family transcriptional regulator [Ktedonobacterales bacterium]|nr:IclR family transcriptional regulator [Ktedonobacterales bacterium]